MKTYIITGVAGFLGSNLAKRLLDMGHRVLGLDNLVSSTGMNLNRLNEYPNFKYSWYDITDPDVVSFLCVKNKFIGSHRVYGIFNLACPASPPYYQSMPIETTLTCVLGAHHMLQCATHLGCTILQTSTSEVYGDPDVHPQVESYRGRVNSFGPRACYDEGKRAAEALFYDYHKQKGTDIRIVRIFNTFGPGMKPDDGRVVTNFITQALANKPLTIYGDGEQTRSFCYVDDLIEALLVVWNSDHQVPVNIGNPGEYTMNELAEKIINITNSKGGIVREPLPADDPMQRCPDISLAKSLGWDGPKISLDTALQNTVQYFHIHSK